MQKMCSMSAPIYRDRNHVSIALLLYLCACDEIENWRFWSSMTKITCLKFCQFEVWSTENKNLLYTYFSLVFSSFQKIQFMSAFNSQIQAKVDWRLLNQNNIYAIISNSNSLIFKNPISCFSVRNQNIGHSILVIRYCPK